MRLGLISLFSSVGIVGVINLRSGDALRWKVEDRRLGMSKSVMWLVDTSKIVAPTCVG
jgi:hypothetical protein